MQVTQGLPVHSAQARCYTCQENSGLFINTGIVIEGEGILSICAKCVGKMATPFSYRQPRELADLQLVNSDLRDALKSSESEISQLRDLITHMEAFASACSTLFPPSAASPSVSPADSPPSVSPSASASARPRTTKPRS